MSTRERWGTFSVKDHLRPQAFVSELLLFDRLVIPYPANDKERNRWHNLGWNPDALDPVFEILGDKAILFSWYEDLYKDRFMANKADLFTLGDIQNARQSRIDPFYITRQIIADEAEAAHHDDLIKVWTLPAYPSKKAYTDFNDQTPAERKTELASVIANKFLTPDDPGRPYNELLTDTLAVSKDNEFLRKREALNEWQVNILSNQLTTAQAVNEMETRLKEYNDLVKRASRNVTEKVAFLALEILLGLAGAKLDMPLESASAMVSIAKFWKFEKKPEIDANNRAFVASMIYEARESLNFGD